jgi:hypothetical protein
MVHCVNCRFWESESAGDNTDGLAICLKLTEETMVRPGKRMLRIIRTRGDHTCEFWKLITKEQLVG